MGQRAGYPVGQGNDYRFLPEAGAVEPLPGQLQVAPAGLKLIRGGRRAGSPAPFHALFLLWAQTPLEGW